MPLCSIQNGGFSRETKWTCKKLFLDNNIWSYHTQYNPTASVIHSGNQTRPHTHTHTHRKLYQISVLLFDIYTTSYKSWEKTPAWETETKNKAERKKNTHKRNGTQKTHADNANSRILTSIKTKRKFT